ncbi:hypothetical protein BST81_25675 [Leptolyngbya sp. 'hensonii']|nr:hypothetical protein BST81_25675 [Leptolyngbya sp. 'hensonii']
MQQDLRILLVEDNPADADLLQETLEEAGVLTWTVSHVERLDAAIAAIHQEPFEIILSDLSLPDAQGLESVIGLRAAAPELPIVVLTGLNNTDIGLAALRQGAQDYLVKGQIQPELLIRTIRYAIERSQIQQVLYQQSAAMAASMEGIAILNDRQEYIYVNQAFLNLYGYQFADDILGTTLDALHQHSGFGSLWRWVEPAIQRDGHWRGELIARRLNQEIFYQELLITALNDGGFVCNVRDVTERKRIEAEILQTLEREKELNELKSNFLSIVSHEFRTPLTTILSSVELLQKYSHQVSTEKNQLRFRHIVNGVKRMTHLLNHVLVFNQAEAGKLPFNPVLLDVLEFCHGLIEEMQLQAGDTHQIIFSHPGSQGQCYRLDENLLRHILTNLISNAIKYSPSGSKVFVNLVCEPQAVHFSIADQGIGIPPADLERLFSIFRRGSNVGNIPGTGLGLAIVHQCVELHQGKIEVTSEVGKGTVFKVVVPVVARLVEAEGVISRKFMPVSDSIE